MPPRGLPGNANLEQLRKGAKSFQHAVRAGDAGAAEVVNEFHPRRGSAVPGSPELAGFTRADAQLVVARSFGFASWPKLKAHLELVERYSRSPRAQPVGEPVGDDESALGDEFLRLGCLNYGEDDPARWARARELLAADPARARAQGGPFAWEPLLYLTYSRVDAPGPGRAAVEVARLLLDHGADPNNDQALFNRAGTRDDGWLALLFEFGLGSGDGGPWRRLLGDRQASPWEMVQDLLIRAAHGGFADRTRLLLAHGVDPAGMGTRHPIFEGRAPIDEAALLGYPEVAELLAAAGAQPRGDDIDRLISACTAGDRGETEALRAGDPTLVERATARRPAQLARAAEKDSLDAVELLIELGFDVNAGYWRAPLHEAAMRGNLAMIRLLLAAGADPNLHDRGYDATPRGWAEHHGLTDAEALLAPLTEEP